jgi:hypothetical protein
MKMLKREEIYANDYMDLDHLRRNIEAFMKITIIAAACTRRSATNRQTSSNGNSGPR